MSCSTKTELNNLLSCIDNLKSYLNMIQSKGQKWVFSTEHTLLNETDDEKFVHGNISEYYDSLQKSEINSDSLTGKMPPSIEKKPFSKEMEKTNKPVKEKNYSDDNFLKIKKSLSNYDIIFVRLCPSEEEMNSNAPYSDESAVILDKIVDALGWESVYKTYLIKYHLDYIDDQSTQYLSWVDSLLEEIEGLNSKIVICWGERVAQMLSGKNMVIEDFLKNQPFVKSNYQLFCFWDPFYFMKLNSLKNIVWSEIKKINQFYRTIC